MAGGGPSQTLGNLVVLDGFFLIVEKATVLQTFILERPRLITKSQKMSHKISYIPTEI